jgi:N-acetylglucosamine-6-phosphate deacetylase
MKISFINGNILFENRFKKNLTVVVADNKIESISLAERDKQPSDQFRTVDLEGDYLVPGLIDLQLYGTEGNFFGGEPSIQNLEGMENTLIKQGICGFLATIATNKDDIVLKAIEAAKAFRKKSKGAFLGLHLEGPFLNPIKKGAHPESLIRKAHLKEIVHWLELANGEIKMMTIAPELQDEEVLKLLNDHHVTLSVGHSNASYEEANSFLNKYVTTSTHLFNAMPSLHHRDPGLILSIFEKKPFASIIPDGIHVSYPMIALAKRELDKKLFIITDAVASFTTGVYQHQKKIDHYETPEGILSGSAITLLEGVKNCVNHVGIKPSEAFTMASRIPAEVIGVENEIGSISIGRKANLLRVDKNFELKEVWFTFTE